MDISLILNKVNELIEPVLANFGYELIEREFVSASGRWVLRLYIDKEGGVTIDDCAFVSHAIEHLIEVEEIIPVSYSIEVSSPGTARPIRRKKDFEKFVGSEIRLKTLMPINGRANFKGILEKIDGDDIVMVVDGAQHRVPLSTLARARLEPETHSADKKIN